MNELARLTMRGRKGQVAALATTILFSATLIGAFGLLLETGLRGQVGTGEYAEAPVLLGAPQSLPVRGDADVPVPGRALVPAGLVDDLRDALPSARVVVDHLVPATLVGASGEPLPVDAHPWHAILLGDRDLASGRQPAVDDEIAIPIHLATSIGVTLGEVIELGFGDQAQSFTVAGLTTNDDVGIDIPDVYLTTGAVNTHGGNGQAAAVGLWPTTDDDHAVLGTIAAQHGARSWDPHERGRIEVVAQGPATAMLASAGGAFGGLAFIVAVFMVITLVGLQVRERSRELAILRVVGATSAQVKRLLRTEIRWVALGSSVLGGILGPFLGALVIVGITSVGALPRELPPVFGPWPFLVPVLVGLTIAEVAVRGALRGPARGSPLPHLDGADDRTVTPARTTLRIAVGFTLVMIGVAMAAAPWYASGEASSALPALSGLVVALSFGPLGPGVIRLAVRAARRPAQRSAMTHLAVNSIGFRAGRAGSVLAPVGLAVAIGCVQLLTATTVGAIARDQSEVGQRADLVIQGSAAGIGQGTTEAIQATAGVATAEPVVATSVVARGDRTDDAWQTLSALGIATDGVEHYADLGFRGDGGWPPAVGEVALGVQGAALLQVQLGDTITIVLPDGRLVSRLVTSLYGRGMGFGEVLLPRADLQPSTAAGRPSAIAVTVDDDTAVQEAEARIRELLDARPGLAVARRPLVSPLDAAPGETAFQALLLLILFGYLAIAVVNSLVTATLARRTELSLLRVVGATPSQLRALPRWEALLLAATGCGVGTLAVIPGLSGMAYALSNHERLVPAIHPLIYGTIVVVTFVLVLTATALPTRAVMRRVSSG